MECAFRKKLEVLNRRSPSSWSEQEFEYIRKAISYDLPFQQPAYSETRLQPVDMAAHLQVLGESLKNMANTLQQQVRMTSFLTFFVPAVLDKKNFDLKFVFYKACQKHVL